MWVVECPNADHGRLHVFDNLETAARHLDGVRLVLGLAVYMWNLEAKP